MRNLLLFVTISSVLSSYAWASPLYRVTDLAVPVDTFPYYIDMNDYGQIAGSTVSAAPFVWTPTVPRGTAGTYAPLQIPPSFSHFATAINERGQIVGATNDPSPGAALLWQPQTPNGMHGEPTLLPPAFGFAHGINASGQISGQTIVSQVGAGFLFTPQTPNGTSGTTVTPLVGGKLFDVNDYGQLTGANLSGVVLWQPTTPNATTGSLVPIGVTSNANLPIKINETGQVAGEGGPTGAFIWTPVTPNGTTGVASSIPRFPNLEVVEVLDLNDDGTVLGTSYSPDGLSFRPWLWSPSEGLVDLNTLLHPEDVAAGWVIERAGAINNHGTIVALAGLSQPGGPDLARTVLLTVVPEPTSALMASAACLLSYRLRRR